jgi:N-acetylglucosaminyldiphosphoundecaprenol N-acetyl-beta-D-mannosaminyltransferase
MPLMAAGVFFTYTRSTWLGLAASAFVVAAIEIPKRWRLPAVTMAALCGVLMLATSWSSIVGLEREGSAAESEHSVDQRKSFASVSWYMFRENPVLGVGFGRFYDRKLPYLSDRSQDFELESIRGLHHHNTFLSVLTETGLIGLTLLSVIFVIWSTCAWRLAHDTNLPPWSRTFGVLLLALVANYLCSALFHDLTLLPSQQLLLFAFAAVTVNMRQQAPVGATEPRRRSIVWPALPSTQRMSELPVRSRPETTVSPVGGYVELFGMKIARIDMSRAVAQVVEWCRAPRGETCRFVVTPNVDHAVLFQHHADLRAAYANAALVLADGAPVVLASRLLGRPLPERVAGSDLVPQLFASANEANPLRVFLLGAAPGVAETAARRIETEWPAVKVVGCYSPPLGFERDNLENAQIFSRIAEARPDVVIVGFGAPKQEIWVHEHSRQLQAKVAICAGATIDFLAGNRERSPVWMRRAGLEWLHRLGSEPRRLATRYARDAWIFPQLVWREWRTNA